MGKLHKIFFYFFLLFLNIGCDSSVSEKKIQAELEYKNGEKYIEEILLLFTEGKLDQVASKFTEVCLKGNPTPVNKLLGYSYVFHSFIRKERYDSALLYQDSCISIIEDNKLEKILPSQYLTFLLYKSASLYYLHRPNEANNLFYKVKKMNVINEDIASRSQIANQMGFISYRQKNYTEALFAFTEVLTLHYQLMPTNYYAETELISNVGLCYFHLKMYDSALSYFGRAINVLDKNKSKLAHYIATDEGNALAYQHSKGVVLGNIAHVFTSLQQWDSVIAYSLPSIACNRDMRGERRDAQKVSSRLIDAYIELRKWNEANKILQQVQRTLDSLPDENVRMKWHLQKAVLLEATGNLGNALPHYKKYTHIKDSLQQIELADAESDLVKDLQIRNQESDLAVLKKDSELNKLYLYITVGLIIIAVVIIAFIFYTYKKTKRNNHQLYVLNTEINEQKMALDQSIKDKDRILRVVAHDLRNPISGIAALSKTLSEHENTNPYLKMIEQTSQQTLYLVNELLQNNMEADVLQMQAASISTTLINAVELIQPTAQQKGILVTTSLDSEEVKVMLDVSKIERVWNNLLSNAVKFSNANTSISVNSKQRNHAILISFKDNGIGIPKDMQETLFNKASNARRKGTAGEKSFGLGLSICKEIVEAHGGKIWVESEENWGSVFFVELPIVQ